MPQKLPAHPLVVGLAAKLGSAEIKKAIETALAIPDKRELGNDGPVAPEDLGGFGLSSGSPEIRTFAGYLGGRCRDGGSPWWQVLFFDITLNNWIIVLESKVLYSARVTDPTAAGGERDFIWVTVDTMIGRGDTTTSPANLFLTGNFTRAGDFATAIRGDTFSGSASGLLCEAITPGCCGGKSKH